MTQQLAKDDPLAYVNINSANGGASEFEMLVQHMMGKAYTITLVMVEAVESGAEGPVGFVDVKPMVHMLDGAGNIHELGTQYHVPYFRLQGGSNAVIIDPQVGDIGICAFASRDISAVKRNKKASAPSSRRQFDCSDGLYIGGVLNGAPSQFIHFMSNGIKVFSPQNIMLEAGGDIDMRSGGSVNTSASGAINSQSKSFTANTQETAKFTGAGGLHTEGEIKSDTDVKAGSISLNSHDHQQGVGKPV